MTSITKEYLQAFEEEIAEIYKTGVIKAPIHLRDGNEDQLIKIFKNVNKEDFVFSTWASHLHALLKGIPRDEVKKEILEGRSITLNFPDHNFYSSAIVGGTCPISVGTAWAIKKRNGSNRVYIFIGDMALHTGIASESVRYSANHDLPITWVVEDNKKSVDTPTEASWNSDTEKLAYDYRSLMFGKTTNLIYYRYTTKYPHAGTGTFVHF